MPPKFIMTDKLARDICENLATNTIGIKKLCSINNHWPSWMTIIKERVNNPDFAEMYNNAKKSQVDLLVEETLEIADNSSEDIMINDFGKAVCNKEFILRARLRIDTRKWYAGKIAPKLYGDKLETTATVTFKNHEDALMELDK